MTIDVIFFDETYFERCIPRLRSCDARLEWKKISYTIIIFLHHIFKNYQVTLLDK